MSEQEKCGKVINSLAETREFIATTKNMFKIGFPDIVSDVFDNALCAISDAIILLKAQEPRVMTLEEVKQHNNQDGCVWFEQPTYNADAAFVLKDDFMIQVISPYILGKPINHGYWTNGNYGKTWRCWTSRPDQATREVTPWN